MTYTALVLQLWLNAPPKKTPTDREVYSITSPSETRYTYGLGPFACGDHLQASFVNIPRMDGIELI